MRQGVPFVLGESLANILYGGPGSRPLFGRQPGIPTLATEGEQQDLSRSAKPPQIWRNCKT